MKPSRVVNLIRVAQRLQAQDWQMELQIGAWPHYTGTKSDKHAGTRARREIMATLRRMAMKAYARDGKPVHDEKGRLILRSGEQFRTWLASFGVTG